MYKLRSIKVAAAISVSAVLAIVTSAVAQDEATGTEFGLTISLVEISDGEPISIGAGRTALAVNQVAHLFGDDEFLNYAVGECSSLQIVDIEAGTIEIDGYCSYRDSDGDQVFERFATDAAVPIGVISLTGEFIGGTGKFDGIAGTVATEMFGFVEDREITVVGGRKTGRFIVAGEVAPAAVEAPAPAQPAPAAEVEDDGALFAALMEEGALVYRRIANCAGCHGNEGLGDFAPRLAGDGYLASVGGVLGIILGGFTEHGMPAFSADLDNRQVAAVATFVRNSWGNEFGLVREEWVANRR
ncbi:MAG: c-type cytochrome [Alphaproteobacteria bacterium]